MQKRCSNVFACVCVCGPVKSVECVFLEIIKQAGPVNPLLHRVLKDYLCCVLLHSSAHRILLRGWAKTEALIGARST